MTVLLISSASAQFQRVRRPGGREEVVYNYPYAKPPSELVQQDFRGVLRKSAPPVARVEQPKQQTDFGVVLKPARGGHMDWKERQNKDLWSNFMGRAPLLEVDYDEWKRRSAEKDRRVWDPVQQRMVIIPGQPIERQPDEEYPTYWYEVE